MKAVLFDLDGTLLPMDLDAFVNIYFKNLAAALAPRGYDPEKLIAAIWGGTKAMVKNDGSCTNEEAFWNTFCAIFGEKARDDMPIFDEFYAKEFDGAHGACGFDYTGAQIVYACWRMGIKVALATNPIFPTVATNKRIDWAGLFPDDFALVTTYENSHYCKPNLKYYEEILEKLGVSAEECLMVGNDVDEDMVASELGMNVFLLKWHMINKHNKDIEPYPHGGYDELYDYILQLRGK